ncbi:16S rRNA (cytidine(1402)-2'-O)-methyltransferase [Gemelliphila palaticanis]|uniref:Ribosomal RNA small subunit methyltransferase I n=1 Tax=Gemelliphila palaticanis TaxID=81950 RepID=A0ABX2SY94_9BACL|nr:16S rRNA (cytidine(1402)-2'-O)-methyltransferase [Gemella palaticanis]MBF0715219.1 16S rRNA (cytidine(1402)-2'-O)-methyltransferase [Gemella palaticanis]NYS47149.1 16S rRNA (cytidine(1402)-2'-O)-methyltransferase [Gemella palaticanis]
MLYLVSTPIGNLEDITLRALRILKEVDIIACEDTRNTKKLLNYYNIENKKLISYHEHNEEKSSIQIIEYLKENKTIALVTDAGMPCISDPGYILIKKCISENIKVNTVPGANAGLTALVSSGIESYNYTFYGFLPRKNNELRTKLNEILLQNTTAIIYESPHRIKNVVEKIVELDSDREISVARELTKMYEQIETDTSQNILFQFNEEKIKEKGEFVLIISPNKNITRENIDNNQLLEEVEELVQSGMKNSEAIKFVSRKYNINKREVYNLYHEKNL